MPLTHLLVFAFLLFLAGATGVVVRRNLLVVLMCVELMLGGANLAFVAASRATGDSAGHVMALMVFVVAAVEVAVGLAIVVAMYRQRRSIEVDALRELRG